MTETTSFNKAYGSERRLSLDVAVWMKSDGFCWYCGRPVKLFTVNPDDRVTVDHIVSQADGGGDDFGNLAPACKSCNSGKGRRSIEAFRWTLYRKAHGLPNFSPDQRNWLMAQGFVFEGLSDFKFWFEREGLS